MTSIPTTHKALVVDNKRLKLVTQDLPKYDDLLVQVKAVALNPTDWKHATGGRLPDGASSGSDFAGIVVDSKAGGQYKKGDRVAGFTRGGFLQTDNGAFAEYIAAQTPIVWRIPDKVSFVQAAALGGIPGDTAAQALYTRLDIPRPWSSGSSQNTAVKKGDSILIWSGAASVSFYAVQLASLVGLTVYTTASTKHHQFLQSIGADFVYDYKDPNVADAIYKDSKGQIKVALDGISEHGSIELAVKSLSKEGSKVITLLPPPEDKKAEFEASKSEVTPTLIYSVLETKNKGDRDDIAEWHEHLTEILEAGKIKFHNIDERSGGLENIQAGLDDLQNGKVSGQKIVYSL